jgi:hypothetical protein
VPVLAASGLPNTSSVRKALDCKVAPLEKWQGNLATARESSSGAEDKPGPPVERALWLLVITTAEAEDALQLLAEEVKWSDSKVAEKLKESRAPADHLIETAKKTRKDIAVANRAAKMRSEAKEAAEAAIDLPKEKSTNYAIDEVDDEIRMFEERGQKLAELLK